MKKIIANIHKQYLTPYYQNPSLNLQPWADTREKIYKEYHKALKRKLKKKNILSWLDELVLEYIEARINQQLSDSSLSVLQRQGAYQYRHWLQETFPSTQMDRLASEAAAAYYFELFVVVHTLATLAQCQYPFTPIKQDFKNYRLKKYRSLDFTQLVEAVKKREFVVTKDIAAQSAERITSQYNFKEITPLPREKLEITNYAQYLAQVELYIRFAQVLSPSALRELKALHKEAVELGLRLDYTEFILHRTVFP